MKTRRQNQRIKIPIHIIILSVMAALFGTGCGHGGGTELFHRFPDKLWARFNLLSFEIPVQKVNSYDIYLLIRLTPDFQYETLDFNMIMNTPSGEERFHEYQMKVKSKSGDFIIECNKDSCLGSILLKKELLMSKTGILKIEIENLTPRLTTEGVLGVGVRMVPSGK